MINKLIVFISSKADLTTYRDAAEKVLRALEVEGSSFETWPSVPNPDGPMAECLRRLRESDAVIVILGEKYGTVVEDGLTQAFAVFPRTVYWRHGKEAAETPRPL